MIEDGIFGAVMNTPSSVDGMVAAVQKKREQEHKSARNEKIEKYFVNSDIETMKEVLEEKHEMEAEYKKMYHTPIVNKNKVGRNEPCPCGSGKKFKNCCGK